MSVKYALAAVALALTGGAAVAAPFYEDFESYIPGAPANISSNWTVTNGSVDVIPVGSQFVWYGAGQYLDMNGTSQPNSAARIETTLFLNPGLYELSFDFGYNVNSGSNEVLNFGIGSFTDALVALDFGTVVPPTFGQYSNTFTITLAGNYTLFFADGNLGQPDLDNDWGGAILDNISVSAVPVPATASLLLLALGGLGIAGRRKRAV